MPIIDVEGLGELEFPDGMTDQEMEAAIKTHPDYQRNFARQHNIETNPASKDAFEAARKKSVVDKFVRQIAHGFPVLGKTMDNTPEDQKFKEEHPYISGGANLYGFLGGALPVSRAASAAVTGAKETLPKLLPDIFAQAGAFGGLNVADKVAEKGLPNVTFDEAKKAFTYGAAGGATGPLLGKLISPNLIPPPKIPPVPKPNPGFDRLVVSEGAETKLYDEVYGNLDDLLAKDYPSGAPPGVKDAVIAQLNKLKFGDGVKPGFEAQNKAAAESLHQRALDMHAKKVADLQAGHHAKLNALKGEDSALAAAGWGLAGTLLGHAAGGLPGAAAGAIASPFIRKYGPNIAGNYIANQAMADPFTAALMKSLMGGTGMAMD